MPPSNIYSIPAHSVTRVCTARFCSCTSPVCFEGCSHSVPQRTLTWWAYRESRKGSSRQSLRKPHTASSAGRPPPSVGDRWSPQTWCLWRHNETTSQHETQPDFSQTSHFYPVNMPDPICIQSVSARKCWPEVGWMILAHQLAFGPDLSGQNLNQSVRTRYRLVLHNMIRAVCGRTQPSLKVGNWKQAGCVLLEPGPMITSLLSDQMHLAKTWPGHPDWIQASFAEYDPGLLWKNGSELDAEVWSGKYDPDQFCLHAGHNGHNASESDLACLLRNCMFSSLSQKDLDRPIFLHSCTVPPCYSSSCISFKGTCR